MKSLSTNTWTPANMVLGKSIWPIPFHSETAVRLTRFREYMKEAGLLRVRLQNYTAESIRPTMQELRPMYPKAGLREMHSLLFHERSMWVSRCVNGLICVRSHRSCFNRSVLQDYFHTHEPALLHERKVNCFRRKRFWAARCNDLTVFDQHDK